MKKRNQGILRQGKGLTSAVLITIMLLTGSLHGLAATNGFTFEDWDTVYSREFDGRRKENRMTTPGEAEPERLARHPEVRSLQQVPWRCRRWEKVRWEISGITGTGIFHF